MICSVLKQMADQIARLEQRKEDLRLKLEQVCTCNLSLASSRKTTNSTPIFFRTSLIKWWWKSVVCITLVSLLILVTVGILLPYRFNSATDTS